MSATPEDEDEAVEVVLLATSSDCADENIVKRTGMLTSFDGVRRGWPARDKCGCEEEEDEDEDDEEEEWLG